MFTCLAWTESHPSIPSVLTILSLLLNIEKLTIQGEFLSNLELVSLTLGTRNGRTLKVSVHQGQ